MRRCHLSFYSSYVHPSFFSCKHCSVCYEEDLKGAFIFRGQWGNSQDLISTQSSGLISCTFTSSGEVWGRYPLFHRFSRVFPITFRYSWVAASPSKYSPIPKEVVRKGSPNSSLPYGEAPVSALGLVLTCKRARGKHLNQFILSLQLIWWAHFSRFYSCTLTLPELWGCQGVCRSHFIPNASMTSCSTLAVKCGPWSEST